MKHAFSKAIFAITVAVAVSSVPALASGGGGGGGGGAGYGGGSFLQPGGLIDPADAAYSRGQSYYRKRIACKTCAFPKGASKDVMATEIAAKVHAGEFDLAPEQRADVLIYLRRRYGVRG